MAFVALACAAAKFVSLNRQADQPIIGSIVILCIFSIPVLLCGAIGVLGGRLKSWFAYGVVVGFLLLGSLTWAYIAIASKSR